MNKSVLASLSIFVLMVILLCTNVKPGYAESDKSKPKSLAEVKTGNMDTSAVKSQKMKPSVHVFMENSGSMYGYIQSNSKFDSNLPFVKAVGGMLVNIINTEFTDLTNLHVYYINTKPFEQKCSVSSFIQNLNVHNAHTWGNGATTMLSTLLDTTFNYAGKNSLAVFVSDCIFSPKQGVSASSLLTSEEMNIVTMMAKHKGCAVLIYQLHSNFSGKYYDCLNRPHNFNGMRPYYVIVAGSRALIRRFYSKVKLDGGYTHVFGIFPAPKSVKYNAHITAGSGQVDNATILSKCRADKQSKKFAFSVDVDFSNFPISNKVLLDPKNYAVSNGHYKISGITKSRMPGKTHSIKLVYDNVSTISPGNIQIELKQQIPTWVSESSTMDDRLWDESQYDKTFGFENMVKALYKATYQSDRPTTLAKMTITIK